MDKKIIIVDTYTHTHTCGIDETSVLILLNAIGRQVLATFTRLTRQETTTLRDNASFHRGYSATCSQTWQSLGVECEQVAWTIAIRQLNPRDWHKSLDLCPFRTHCHNHHTLTRADVPTFSYKPHILSKVPDPSSKTYWLRYPTSGVYSRTKTRTQTWQRWLLIISLTWWGGRTSFTPCLFLFLGVVLVQFE